MKRWIWILLLSGWLASCAVMEPSLSPSTAIDEAPRVYGLPPAPVIRPLGMIPLHASEPLPLPKHLRKSGKKQR